MHDLVRTVASALVGDRSTSAELMQIADELRQPGWLARLAQNTDAYRAERRVSRSWDVLFNVQQRHHPIIEHFTFGDGECAFMCFKQAKGIDGPHDVKFN